MDGLTNPKFGTALLVILLVPAATLGADGGKSAMDPGMPILDIPAEAVDGLKDLARALEDTGAAYSSATARLRLLERAWRDDFRSGLGDSSVVAPSAPERLAAAQIGLVDSLLAQARTLADTVRMTRQSEYLASAIASLADMEPILSSLRDSRRSALLVVSSVSCECERRRCEKMLKVYDSVSALHPTFAVAVVDHIVMPSAITCLGLTAIPSWVLFNEHGAPASIISGFEESGDTTEALEAWLGEKQ